MYNRPARPGAGSGCLSKGLHDVQAHGSHDRKCAPRPRVALAVAGGRGRGHPDVQDGVRPFGRVQGLYRNARRGLGLQPGPVGGQGALRTHPQARRRGALGGGGRVVDPAGLQPADGRVLPHAGAPRRRVAAEKPARPRDRRVQRGLIRPQRHAAHLSAGGGPRRLRLHAPRAARKGPARRPLQVAKRRRRRGDGVSHRRSLHVA